MKHNWEYKNLDDVCTIKSGYTPSSDELAPSGDFPYFKVAEMNLPGNEKYLMYSPSYLSGEIKTFPANSIVFPKNGAAVSTNKKRILQVDSVVDLNTAVMIVNQNISVNFMYYILINIDFATLVKRGAVPTLNISKLKNTFIPVPPMEVQERIVAELDKINEVIADCRELLRTLDALAQSLFYDYFGDPVTNPKGWDTQKLSDIAPQYPYKGAFSFVDDLWLLNLDMIEKNSGRIIKHQKVHYEDLGNSVYRICPNQVLYSKLRPNLNKVVIADDFGYCTSELLPLNPKNDLMNCQYLAYLLRTKECVAIFSSKVAGAKMPRTDLKAFRSFQIPVPPLSLQEKFAGRIEAIEAIKANTKSQIDELQTLLNSRMDYWFN